MKSTAHLSIDSDILEAAKVKRFKDGKFSLSEEVNSYLREFFNIEIEDLEQSKIDMEVAEAEKKLAIARAKQKALENEEARKEKEDEKLYGKKYTGD